jgi:hypothetical protein
MQIDALSQYVVDLFQNHVPLSKLPEPNIKRLKVLLFL